MKKILISILVLVLAFGVVGCSSNNGNKATVDESKISISGSTSVEKIMVALADEYMAEDENIDITYEAIGSSAGVKNAKDGVTDLGTASRELKDTEKEWGLNEKVISYDGIAIIVHPDNTVADLTREQVKGIYNGEISNWKEVGGIDEAIVVVSREDGSGTRGAFEEILGLEAIKTDAIIAEGNGNVQTTVAGNPKSIGYVSFSSIDNTVKAIDIEGQKPTQENVQQSIYSISRPFILVYNPEKSNQTITDFIDFIMSDAGQKIVEKKGGIPVSGE